MLFQNANDSQADYTLNDQTVVPVSLFNSSWELNRRYAFMNFLYGDEEGGQWVIQGNICYHPMKQLKRRME